MLILTCLLLALEPLAILHLDIVESEKDKQWGLMGKESIEDGYGMLFTYKKPTSVNFWMFNVFIDLSLAYLNEEGTILELHELKAHPEKMDPKREVNSLKDLKKYSYFDPTVDFFRKEAVYSKEPVSYVLETKKGFFTRHKIRVGDYLLFDPNTSIGKIYRR